jgi:hypothetical protein
MRITHISSTPPLPLRLRHAGRARRPTTFCSSSQHGAATLRCSPASALKLRHGNRRSPRPLRTWRCSPATSLAPSRRVLACGVGRRNQPLDEEGCAKQRRQQRRRMRSATPLRCAFEHRRCSCLSRRS